MFSHIIIKFQENRRGFWEDYRWFIVVFALALLCDAASTVYFMLESGPETELHPVIQFISSHMLGPIAGPLFAAFAKLTAGIVVAVYCRKFAAYIFSAVSVISFWAAWYNVWGFRIYTPSFLKWIPW